VSTKYFDNISSRKGQVGRHYRNIFNLKNVEETLDDEAWT